MRFPGFLSIFRTYSLHRLSNPSAKPQKNGLEAPTKFLPQVDIVGWSTNKRLMSEATGKTAGLGPTIPNQFPLLDPYSSHTKKDSLKKRHN